MNKIVNSMRFHKRSRLLDSVHSMEKFQESLKKERLRTNRNELSFSLVIFGTVTDLERYKIFEKLIKVMLTRVRATDEVGWYSDHKIGLLLPDTTSEGAKLLVGDILSNLDERKQLVYEIQSYPNKVAGSQKSINAVEVSESDGEKVSQNDGSEIWKIESGEIDEIFAPPTPTWKRGLDILGAGLGLVILCPVFLFIGVFIKFVSPGPIFYKQTRVGFRKKQFTCWKFRTMKVEADTAVHKEYLQALIKYENECMNKLDDCDARIIPGGKVLRKTGLDELPQLINILLGDMSLVGPRPCTVYEACEYRIWHHGRFDTKPGLTGLWQVSGKNKTSFIEMIRLDIGYANRKSILKDIWILIRTFPAVWGQIFDRLPKKKE